MTATDVLRRVDVDREAPPLAAPTAALGFLQAEPREPELQLLHRWLDNWAGVGRVVAGMSRRGWDLQLTVYGDGSWRATFYVSGMVHSISQIDLAELQESIRRGHLLHLELESFYLFSKILLDRVADVIADYSGMQWKSRGSSHSELTGRFQELCAAADVDGRAIRPTLHDLQERVVLPRNKMIEHLTDPRRLRSTSVDMNTGSLCLSTLGMILPDPGDMERITYGASGDLKELYGALHRHLSEVILFLVRTPLSLLEFMQRWKQLMPGLLDRTIRQAIKRLEEAKARGSVLRAQSAKPNEFSDLLTAPRLQRPPVLGGPVQDLEVPAGLPRALEGVALRPRKGIVVPV